MSAAPSYAPSAKLSIPGGFTPLPTVIVQNISRLTPAEVYLALVVAHRPDVTDTMWEEYTGKDPRTKENAVRGLWEKKLFPSPAGTPRGLSPDAEFKHFLKSTKGRYALDVRSFTGWARHANPRDTRTAGRAPTKPPEPTMHPECKSGCAMADGRAELIPLPATNLPKPVSSAEVVPSVTPQSPERMHPQRAPFLQPKAAESEGGWWNTLAAMRGAFSTVGTALLMQLVALVLALFPDVTDEELAAAVGVVWRERGSSMRGPGLFLTAVPDVVKNMRARGRPLPATEEAKPVSPLTPEEIQAFEVDADARRVTKAAEDKEWAKLCFADYLKHDYKTFKPADVERARVILGKTGAGK